MILLTSVFRDSTSYVQRYLQQVADLRAATTTPIHVVAVEGDSEDDTYELLAKSPEIDTLLVCEHGGQKWGSIDHPMRWRQIATACNTALCAAVRLSEPEDVWLYVESDLLWSPLTMLKLISDLDNVPAVAPMSMMGGRFYDIWGHRKDGRGFSAHPPYYPGWERDSHTLSQIDSAGSCWATNYEPLQAAEFGVKDCVLGVGRSIAEAGYSLWVDPSIAVEHP